MDKELVKKFRDRVNRSPFLCSQYSNIENKNKWNCICSAMDWIDVGISDIDAARNEYIAAKALRKSLRFYFYISCIDIVWESIQQLHRAIFNTTQIPFKGESKIFEDNIFGEDDNTFFKTIRACFGEHSVKLNGYGKDGERKFASWSGNFYGGDDFHVTLYSNDPQVDNINLKIKLSQLDEFFNTRYGYLTELMKQIDKIDNSYKEKFTEQKIEISDDPIAQIQILLEENQKRTNSEYYDSTLHRLKSFFETEFHCPENKKLVKEFENQLKYGIKEVMNAIQNNTFFTPYIDSLLEPTYKPRINGWGYAYGKFFERVFIGGSYGLFTIKEITEPLKNYITFDYKTDVELYWLVIIALNLAQDDLKETQTETPFDKSILDFLLSNVNGEEEK